MENGRMETTGFEGQIHTASAKLERMLTPIETVFLDAGANLGDAVGWLDKLNSGFQAIASTLEQDDAVAALDALNKVSVRIGSLGDGTLESNARLESMQKQASALNQRIGRLRKAMDEIDILAINAKIEAAHVTARDVEFTVFTREIGRLAQLAISNLNKLAGELSGLLDNMNRAQADLSDFNRNHRQSLETVSAQLTSGLVVAAQRRSHAAQSVRVLSDVSLQMASRVASVVEALQVGDITRQRAEHVREALGTLLEVLKMPPGEDAQPLSDDHKKIIIGSVCRLQGAQAQHAADDLSQDLDRIGENIWGLINDLRELPDSCASVYGEGSDAGSSFLDKLGHDFENVYQLLHKYGVARQSIDDVVNKISSVVEGMVHHIEDIRSIEGDMRMMGLNATFKCSRLGEQGRALSIIAQELRTYSNRTAEDGKAIMAGLTELVSSARDMGESERKTEATGIETEMGAAVEILERIGSNSTASLAELREIGEKTRETLSRSHSLLKAHPEFVSSLRECGATIGELASAIGESSPESIDGIQQEVLELLRSRYTMASERKIHEMFGSGDQLSETAEETSVDDLLF